MRTQADWQHFYKSLGDDFRALNTLFEHGKNAMGRRVFAAYVFTMFESTGRLLINQVNLAMREGQSGSVTERQIKAARAKESQRVDPVEHIIFALKYISAFHHTNDFDPRQVDPWEEVQISKTVRDRVIHPRTVDDLNVTLKEHQRSKFALVWLLNCLTFVETFQSSPGISFAEARASLSKPTRR